MTIQQAAPPTLPADVYELLQRQAKLLERPDYRVEVRWDSRTRAIIVVVYSEKGGVGKTALTTGLAAVAAEAGLNVLVIDMDPRATTTTELGIEAPEYSINDILYIDPEADDPVAIRGAARDYMVSPSADWPQTIRVLAAERALGNREMDNTDGMTERLAASLEGEALDGIDLVLIDVPPRPGGKLVAAAARIRRAKALIPCSLDPDGWDGAKEALKTLRKARAAAGMDPIEVLGVLRHIVDRRRSHYAAEWDRRVRTEEPLAPYLLTDVAVPRYGIRVESRMLQVPITQATSDDGRALRYAYARVLNHIAKAGE